MVHLDRVKRQFGSRVLFEGLSWRIPPGARLGLVGANGTGKTTLLRLICGLDRPEAGAVHLRGGAEVAYLPQEVETVSRGSVLSVAVGGHRELAELGASLEELGGRMAGAEPGSRAAEGLAERYGTLRLRFEALGGDRIESRARIILSGLGIPPGELDRPIETLSGGWRMRVLLARLLLGSPDLLLLDEPTNHLDLDAVAWLEEFLRSYEGGLVIVAHDRYFLNRLVEGIVELDRGRLTVYSGNYDDYVAAREQRREALDKAARQQARELARVQRFIDRFRYKASKARQVQARIRSLGSVESVEPERARRSIRFGFPEAPRSGDVVVRAEGVGKRFADHVVYDGMDLVLRRGDRLALVGPNGAGKSTLLKLLAGGERTDRGRLELGHNVIVRYYAQHQLDELDPGATVLEEVERVSPHGELARLRGLLGAFLFHGDDVDKRVAVLSGGEKARLALARLLLRPANLLLLDEPTNHLDLASREVLERALDEYGGTLVVVSHDRYFINRVATCIGEVGAGRIELYGGAFDEYAEHARRRTAELPADGGGAVGADDARERRRQVKRREAEERNERYRRRRAMEERLRPLEIEIAELEERGRELERLQGDPGVYGDPARARDVGREKAEVERTLARLYGEWERLAAELEPPDQRS